MDTDEDDLRDLKVVCSILKSGTTGENLGKRHSDQLRNTVKRQLNSRLMDQGLQRIILLMRCVN